MDKKKILIIIIFIVLIIILIAFNLNNKKTNLQNNSKEEEKILQEEHVIYNKNTGLYDIYGLDGKYLKSLPLENEEDILNYEMDPYYEPYDIGMENINN